MLHAARENCTSGPQEYSNTLSLCFHIRRKDILFSSLVNFATIVKFNKKYLKVVMGFAHITWEDNMLETVKCMTVLGVRKILNAKLNHPPYTFSSTCLAIT